MSRGRNVKGAKFQEGEMSRRPNVQRAKCQGVEMFGAEYLWGEMSRGLKVTEAKCPEGEMSRGRNVMGAKCQRRQFEFTLLENISKKYSGGKRRFKKSNFLIKQIF